MASRIDAGHRLENSMIGNMQSLVSFSQTQDALLDKMASVVDRIGELATSSSNAFLSDSERNAYELEYQQMVKQFEVSTQEVINEQKFFFSTFSDDKKDFIAALKGGWLRAAEELIESKFGIIGDGDEFNLIINEEDSSDSYAAYVRAYGSGDVLDMVFDMPDFDSPYSFPSSDGNLYFTDRTVAHELVHAVQARNIFNYDVDGDGTTWGGTWFKEGIAEFIHGADFRVKSEIDNGKTVQEIVDAIGTGDESWSSSTQYATGYVAVRYLHDQIKQNGNNVSYNGKTFNKNDGVKALIEWQEEKYANRVGGSETATTSGVGQGIQAFLGMTDDQFIAKYKANGAAYLNSSIDTTNNDTGAIGGKDADSGSEISDQAAVPDTVNSPTGDPDQPLKHWKIAWEEDEGIKINTDSSGSSWVMDSIEPIQFGDTSTYNLSSTDSAALVISRVQALLDNIASGRSKVAANLSRFNTSLERLQERKHASLESLERIHGANLAEESLNLARSTIRSNFSISILELKLTFHHQPSCCFYK